MKKSAFAVCCLAGVLLILPKELPAPTACINVTKLCTNPVEPGAPIPFSGSVINCGYTVLNNVTVVDDNGTPGDTSDDFTLFLGNPPVYLDPGATADFSGSYFASTY